MTERIIEDLGLARRLAKVERDIEIQEDHFRRSNICLNQVEKFYRKWEGKMYYRDAWRR